MPFTKDSDVAVIYAHLNDPPPRPTELRPELPLAIDRVVAIGMAKAPESRYSTCAEPIEAASAALGVNASGASPERLSVRTWVHRSLLRQSGVTRRRLSEVTRRRTRAAGELAGGR
jgi:hypothetical protein